MKTAETVCRTGQEMPEPDGQVLAALKALADPVRLKILSHVAGSSCTVCACSMPDVFGVSQPTLSHHLKKLVEAGLLTREMRGNWAHYSIRQEGFAPVRHLLEDITTTQSSCHEC